MIMGTMKYKGYTGSHDAITYEGKDVDELRKDFEGAVDA